ncbi:hypothetical protein [Sinomonas atrocyanea]|uniref:hypothetical protein n=1 Tax=Sinomonas atrocyanea TaxID=37927 RepID=UPI00285F72FB|nr:hypothetical protein [Sinomonas atrocyanea]MDR6622443.1 hypothetical protein [Sinomonas atrocyanea]
MHSAPLRGRRWPAAAHTVVALLAAGVLVGCSAGPPLAPPRTTAAGPAPSSASPGGASPSRATSEAAPAIHRFTSHPLSFRYPSDWSVAAEVRPIGPGGEVRETATVLDGGGRRLLDVFVNWAPQDVGTEVTRAVLDAEPVPGLGSAAVHPGYYAFYAETEAGALDRAGRPAVTYSMTLSPGRPLDGPGQRHGGPFDSTVQIAAGYSVGADASADLMTFGDAAEALGWLGSEDGQRLKAVLMSLTVY